MYPVNRKVVTLFGDEGFYRFIREDLGYIRNGQPVVQKHRYIFDKNHFSSDSFALDDNCKYDCSHAEMRRWYFALRKKGYQVFPNASDLEYIG